MKKHTPMAVGLTLNRKCERLTIGLDLGDRSSCYCVLDEAGDVLLEQKVSTTPKAMREVFGSMPRCRIALETGTHSPWVSRLLIELGHEAIVAHARNVRLIGESCPTTKCLDIGRTSHGRSMHLLSRNGVRLFLSSGRIVDNPSPTGFCTKIGKGRVAGQL